MTVTARKDTANMAEFKKIKKNIRGKLKGTVILLAIDLAKELGESGSGKSINIATTSGNIDLSEHFKGLPEGTKMGLNIYKPVKKKSKKKDEDDEEDESEDEEDDDLEDDEDDEDKKKSKKKKGKKGGKKKPKEEEEDDEDESDDDDDDSDDDDDDSDDDEDDDD
jgi:hypothetical protein